MIAANYYTDYIFHCSGDHCVYCGELTKVASIKVLMCKVLCSHFTQAFMSWRTPSGTHSWLLYFLTLFSFIKCTWRHCKKVLSCFYHNWWHAKLQQAWSLLVYWLSYLALIMTGLRVSCHYCWLWRQASRKCYA